MEGESKEADTKDNPSKQNNNLVESESNQESGSPSKKKEMNTDNKTTSPNLVNNESNGCDIEKPLNSHSKHEDLNKGKNRDAENNQEVTDMEMGSPEKQITHMIDSQKGTAVKNITGRQIFRLSLDDVYTLTGPFKFNKNES